MDDTSPLLLLATAGLIAAKLMGYVSWSWVVVFAPIWVPAALSLGLELAVVVALGVGLYLWLSPNGWESVPFGAMLEQAVLFLEGLEIERRLTELLGG